MRWIVVCLVVALSLISASVGISHPAFDCGEEVTVDVVQPEDLHRMQPPCAGGPELVNGEARSLNSTTGDCDGAPGPC